MEKPVGLIDGNNAFITLAQGLWSDPRAKSAVTNPVSVMKMVLGYVAGVYKKSSRVVLALDDGTWRKQVFPYYKARRALAKEKSDFPYAEFVECLNSAIAVVKNNSSRLDVIQIPGIEGDDIIGCLAPVLAPVCVYSTDQDLLQLQTNFPDLDITQYSPKEHVYIRPADKKYNLVDHIIRGDDTDDVPNVLSPDTSFVEKIRQTPMIASRYNPLFEQFSAPDFDPETLEGDLKARYIRNRAMVDMRYMPDYVVDKIFAEYERVSETPRNKTLFDTLAEQGILV